MPINATDFKYEPKQLGSFTMVKVRKTSADMSKINDSVTIGASKGRGDRAGSFPVAPRNLSQQKERPNRRRINLLPDGPTQMHQGLLLFTSTKAEPVLGMPIFDRFGPSLNQPVVMSYVSAGVAEMNDKVLAKAITSVYRLSPPTLKDNQ